MPAELKENVRASDEEREKVATALRDHAGEGRLDMTELDERLGAAYSARTRADLKALTADLPRARPRSSNKSDLREHVTAFIAVNLLLVTIWALTGADYFWPIWPFLGWGIGLLSHAGFAPMCGSSKRTRSA